MGKTSKLHTAVLVLVISITLASVTSSPALKQSEATGEESAKGIAVSLRELKTRLDTKEAKRLFGATRLLGFVFAEDKRGKDCILVFAQEPSRPILNLDDITIAFRNVKAGTARPACTIDPTQEVLKRLGEVAQKITAAQQPAEAERLFPQWKKVAGSPQTVRVFNIDSDTIFAKTMVDADYLLKSICDGTESVKGITGYSELLLRRVQEEIAKKGGLGMPLEFLSRFWFNAGKVAYQTDGKLFLLTTCQVTLLTEQEAVNPAGKRSVTGKANPLAKDFADQFTAKFDAIAQSKPVYRKLENLYRSMAVADLMFEEAKKAGALDILDDSLGTAKVTRHEFSSTLPGRGTVKKVEGKLSGGTYVLWLPSCGGVSIDIQRHDFTQEADPNRRLPKVTQAILLGRPGPTAVVWKCSLTASNGIGGGRQ